ncbi:hypothetical protein [Bradyrhizobium sp. Ai1a-2]|uniref:hypothetical protein n=1 Tax=Bradyrhizobium sp. Ai1a-2 TaxID=196490 RepID=UPI00041D7563|nr:hypothetical protein [Bradyrhizobium sp. Ai1a-2]
MFSVVTAATDRKLTTRDNVKTELGITGSAEDAKIDRLINRLSAMVCDYIDVPMASDGSKTLGLETLDEYFDHSPWYRRRRRQIVMARRPVTEIVSVTIGSVTVDPSDYDFDGARGEMRRTGVLPPPSLGYAPGVRTVVRYKAGWTLPATANFTLPLPIEGAVIGLLRAARFAADRDPMVKSEWTTDIEKIDYWVGQIGENGAFPPDIASMLEIYCYEPEFG